MKNSKFTRKLAHVLIMNKELFDKVAEKSKQALPYLAGAGAFSVTPLITNTFCDKDSAELWVPITATLGIIPASIVGLWSKARIENPQQYWFQHTLQLINQNHPRAIGWIMGISLIGLNVLPLSGNYCKIPEQSDAFYNTVDPECMTDIAIKGAATIVALIMLAGSSVGLSYSAHKLAVKKLEKEFKLINYKGAYNSPEEEALFIEEVSKIGANLGCLTYISTKNDTYHILDPNREIGFLNNEVALIKWQQAPEGAVFLQLPKEITKKILNYLDRSDFIHLSEIDKTHYKFSRRAINEGTTNWVSTIEEERKKVVERDRSV